MSATYNLKIFSAVWGKQHLEWFERATCRSLAWPLNKAALQHAHWIIYTTKEDAPRAIEIASQVLPKEQIEFVEMPRHVHGSSPEMGSVLLSGFLHTMRKCIIDGSRMLIAPPDTIFGEGTIPNLLIAGRQPHTCVAVVHPRVSPSIFAQIGVSAVTNPQLVTRAWKHLHDSWTYAEAGLARTNSFVGGVSWYKLPTQANAVAVTHRLPTVYLADFLPADLAFFQQPHDNLPPTFGVLDHGWPAECLIDQQRQRLIGSSDACFIIELTDQEKNIPPLMNANPFEADAFWRDLKHNRFNRQVHVIFRGE